VRFYSRLRLTAVAFFCTILLLSAAQVNAVAGKLQANIRNLIVLDALVHNNSSDKAVVSATLVHRCPDYVTAIGELQSADYANLTPEQQLNVHQRYADCLPSARWSLLAMWSAETQWNVGLYNSVCDSLVSIGAADKLLRLAQQSAEAGKWEAVESALVCVHRFNSSAVWVSPYIVSALYFRLGEHYEQVGDSEQALAAYDSAARWYPVVWAAPMIGKARLLWKQGERPDAIQHLVDGVSHSSDVTATFYLWRELGDYWQQQGDNTDAVCAYRKALEIVDQVPSQNAGAGERERLQVQVESLDAAVPDTCFRQYPQIPAAETASETSGK